MPLKIGGDNYEFAVVEAPLGSALIGKFQEGQAVSFRADSIDFFRRGEVLVYLDGGKWRRTRTGTLSDPLRILIPSAKVRAVRLPHEELAQLDKFWSNVQKKDVKGLVVLSGDVNEKGAKLLARSENRAVAQSAKAQVWLDGKGRVTKHGIAIRLQGRLGGAEVDGESSKLVSLRGVGTTRVEVPAEAKKALEGPPTK